jgi:rfaE bifunctional protein kinase chain/domain
MKKILVTGNFNIIHHGHLRLFKFAKSLGGILVVGVNSDKIAKNDIFINGKLRLESVAACSLIDEVFLIKKNISHYIKKIKPDFIVKGKEHENELNPEKKYLDRYGGKLVFSSGDIVFSSKNLLINEKNYFEKKKNINLNFMKRHKINKNKIFSVINNFKKIKSLVIGDVIIDEYIFCESLGLSQEDNSIIYKIDRNEKFLGGAGIVAAHLASLGSDVEFITVVGNDPIKKFFSEKLKDYKVKNSSISDSSRFTNLKVRYKLKNNTVFRVSNLSNFEIDQKIQDKIFSKVKKIISEKKINLIVFSDFNYGVMTLDLIKKISNYAKKRKICVTADSQISSQIGDVSKYKNIDLLSATEFEVRTSLKNSNDGLVVLSEKLRKITNNLNLIMKLQEDGIFIHSYCKNKFINSQYKNDEIFAINKNPIDAAGAGDSMLAAASLSLALGNDIWVSSLLGSFASAIQISRIGNIPIKSSELKNLIKLALE